MWYAHAGHFHSILHWGCSHTWLIWSSLSWTWSTSSPTITQLIWVHVKLQSHCFRAKQMTEKQTLELHIMFSTFVKIKAENDAMWTGSKLRDGYKIYIDSICDTKLNWYENARSTMYLELKYPLLLAWAKQQIPWGLTKSSFQMPNNCLEKKSFFFFSMWLKANVFCSWLCSSLVTVIRSPLKISLNNGSTVILLLPSSELSPSRPVLDWEFAKHGTLKLLSKDLPRLERWWVWWLLGNGTNTWLTAICIAWPQLAFVQLLHR